MYLAHHEEFDEVPITNEVHKVLFEGKNPRHAVVDLMTRGKKQEIDDLT